jgi:hypothetical protein
VSSAGVRIARDIEEYYDGPGGLVVLPVGPDSEREKGKINWESTDPKIRAP